MYVAFKKEILFKTYFSTNASYFPLKSGLGKDNILSTIDTNISLLIILNRLCGFIKTYQILKIKIKSALRAYEEKKNR